MLEQIANLPYELRERIAYQGGLDLCVKTSSQYLVEKLCKEKDYHWDYILTKMSKETIEYLYSKRYKWRQFLELKNEMVPGLSTKYLDKAIKKNDIKKIELIDLLLPRSVCSVSAFNYALNYNFLEVYIWVAINRPLIFGSLCCKHNLKYDFKYRNNRCY